jgi:hypothetical protein
MVYRLDPTIALYEPILGESIHYAIYRLLSPFVAFLEHWFIGNWRPQWSLFLLNPFGVIFTKMQTFLWTPYPVSFVVLWRYHMAAF